MSTVTIELCRFGECIKVDVSRVPCVGEEVYFYSAICKVTRVVHLPQGTRWGADGPPVAEVTVE